MIKEKQCSQCKKVLFIENFYKHEKHLDKLRSECKECTKKKLKERYSIIKKIPGVLENLRTKGREWYHRNKEKSNNRTRINHKIERKEAIDVYGGKCDCCGESRFEFLAIDHMNGDGKKHRKIANGKITRWLRKNNFPKNLGLRILCHNCNSSLGYYGYCPHKQSKLKIVNS